MVLSRRMAALLLTAALLAAPAAVLQALCIGRSCHSATGAGTHTPFCSLPLPFRNAIGAGFREGRSPDVLAVTRRPVLGGTAFDDRQLPLWPSVSNGDSQRVPLVFTGNGVASGTSISPKSSLDQVAPTVAEIIGFTRPHPEVRSGKALPGVATGSAPRLVLEVIWKGYGSRNLERFSNAWPRLRTLMQTGSGTLDAVSGSLPLDPAAVLTTIGTGGLPFQHGITGTLVRNDAGKVAQAWGDQSPTNVIATLPDDYDEKLRQKPVIALVGTAPGDQGVIGGNWYLNTDKDTVALLPGRSSVRNQVDEAISLLRVTPLGKDETADVMAVVMDGSLAKLDGALARLIPAARAASRDSVATVITATGQAGATAQPGVVPAQHLEKTVNEDMDLKRSVIEATSPGGLFLQQNSMARQKVAVDEVVSALSEAEARDRSPLIADAFADVVVSFERYC
jgi:hypothetical protein